MILLDGKQTAKELKQTFIHQVDKLKKENKIPHLCIIRVGNDFSSILYLKYKKKACEFVGIKYSELVFSDTATEEKVISKIKEINLDKAITGLIVQLPLPLNINKENVINSIDPKKDVDGLHRYNNQKFLNKENGVKPCTPMGIMYLLKKYNINIKGKEIVVLGRSIVVGKPMAEMFRQEKGNVTVCHSQTPDISLFTKKADILVSATGVPHLITEEMIKPNAVVIDVGITRKGKEIFGDVDFESVKGKASYITPNPGGVGPMTIAMLLHNIIFLL